MFWLPGSKNSQIETNHFLLFYTLIPPDVEPFWKSKQTNPHIFFSLKQAYNKYTLLTSIGVNALWMAWGVSERRVSSPLACLVCVGIREICQDTCVLMWVYLLLCERGGNKGTVASQPDKYDCARLVNPLLTLGAFWEWICKSKVTSLLMLFLSCWVATQTQVNLIISFKRDFFSRALKQMARMTFDKFLRTPPSVHFRQEMSPHYIACFRNEKCRARILGFSPPKGWFEKTHFPGVSLEMCKKKLIAAPENRQRFYNRIFCPFDPFLSWPRDRIRATA